MMLSAFCSLSEQLNFGVQKGESFAGRNLRHLGFQHCSWSTRKLPSGGAERGRMRSMKADAQPAAFLKVTTFVEARNWSRWSAQCCIILRRGSKYMALL